jgi:rhombotail lipoprotein
MVQANGVGELFAMKNKMILDLRLSQWLAMLLFVLLLVGCSTVQAHRRASVVEFLYPKKAPPPVSPGIPELSLPMHVGIAFVPENVGSQAHQTLILTEGEKVVLMEQIKRHFKQYAYVNAVDLIPTLYLTPSGSFENLDQIRTMFDIDTIVLLSYDQVQFTDPSVLSYGYATLVGMTFLEGEKNETATMIDAAVYHIPSRKMLFRAPGTSRVKNASTLIHLEEELRHDGEQGFQAAVTNLVANVQEQLEVFKTTVKQSPQDYQVAYKPGHTPQSLGLGKLDASWLLLIAVITGCVIFPRPHGGKK